MKPQDGITYARCNLCWFNIDRSTDHGLSKVFLKISGYKMTKHTRSSSTSCLINHLRSRHPDIMKQFLRQSDEHSNVQNKTINNREKEYMRRKEIRKMKRKAKQESKIK